MAALDNASAHFGRKEFPDGVPKENGATHIGMFLHWLVLNDLESESFRTEYSIPLELLRSKAISGRELLLEYCDGEFLPEMVDTDALDFVVSYYPSKRGFIKDYRDLLARDFVSHYEVENTWENFETLSAQITQRYEKWSAKKSKRPWWKFWR